MGDKYNKFTSIEGIPMKISPQLPCSCGFDLLIFLSNALPTLQAPDNTYQPI